MFLVTRSMNKPEPPYTSSAFSNLEMVIERTDNVKALKDIAYWMVAALEESEIVIQGLSDAANRLQRQKDTIADQYLAERVDSLALLKQQRDQLENTNKQMKAILAIMK